MSDAQFNPQEQALIRRLQDAPQRQMAPRTVEAIRQKMLAELTNPALPAPQIQSSVHLFTPVQLAVGLVLAITVILASTILLLRDPQNDVEVASSSLQTQVMQENTAAPSETRPAHTATTAAPDTSPTFADALLASATAVIPSATELPTLIPSTPTADSPSPTPEASAEPLIVIEGPVQNIDDTTITIFGFTIEVAPDHPILNIIAVGDTLRIEGRISDEGRVTAAVIDNLPVEAPEDATVGLTGPVEMIENNIVTINDIDLALDPDAPLLETLKIGDFLSVEGNFEFRENRYVLVVVYVEIITPAGAGISPNCYYEETGMGMGMGMGRWRCDGMAAMGMGGMGMGN